MIFGRQALGLSLAMAIAAALIPPCQSRNQWDIQQANSNKQQNTPYQEGQTPGQVHTGIPAQFQAPQQLGKGFWQGQHPGFSNRLQPGIMLNGVLDDEISSRDSKIGDLFAINLEEGFVQNGMQVIPRGSRILGAVTHVIPAKSQKSGVPGQLQVSLQTLVLPDGAHLPFAGFIAVNPNHSYQNPPKQRSLGYDIKDTGQHLAGMMGSFTNGIGFMYAKKYRGNDFYMDKGEIIPVRLNKTIIIPEQYVQPVAMTGGTQTQFSMPPGMVPGLAGPDQFGQFQAPKPPTPVPGLVGDADPFNTPTTGMPAARPLNEMPEPF